VPAVDRHNGGMATLKEQLQADLTTAMKSRDELSAATLRMALTAVTNEEVAGKQARTLSDEDVVAVLGKEAKKRLEAAQAYADAGHPDRAERELAELGVLQRYLPEALSDEQIAQIVAAAVAEVTAAGQSGPSAMGAVMKVVQPQVKGRADGGAVAAAVKAALAG